MVPLKTFLFGYPLKFGVYSLISLELVIGAFSLLGFFKISGNDFRDTTECIATVLIAILGLHGVHKDNLVHLSGYTTLQFILFLFVFFELVLAVVYVDLSRLIFDIITIAIMSNALLVTASYRVEMNQDQTRSALDDFPSML